MIHLLQIIIVLGVIYGAYRLLSGATSGGGGRRRLKCSTCRHCKKLFDDGAICQYGDKETFKNEVHIANCPDYEKK
ncbi:MAG: hypothetical protein RL885_00015 [Planctomycetota bacterium]